MNDENITGITVVYNTWGLIERAYASIRRFHPQMRIIIIDGSDINSECYLNVNKLQSSRTKVLQMKKNIGHGPGLNMGIRMANTQYALIFDSDIVMIKSPLTAMAAMMDKNTYGIGWLTQVGDDGFDYGTPGRGHERQKPVTYLHPYFALLSVPLYCLYAPFVHHGSPAYQAMKDLHRRGLSDTMLKQFPGLTGHTSGKGINWTGRPCEWVRHDFGGTRMNNKKHGLREIPGTWAR